MPALGSRAKDVIDADGTDIGGLLNLLEWCPFINPPVSRTLLNSARDECRNRWAHAAKQEICDGDVPTIFSHLNNLLSDPVFNSELSAQKASNDLQDLSRQGLINVRESEVEALYLLRQCLEAGLRKYQEDLAYTLRHLSQLQEDVMEVKEEIETLKHKVQVGPHKGDNDDDDDDILCTAPIGLTEFTGRKSELEWLERNLVLLNPEKKPGTSTCIKTICGLGGCGKTSLAIEFAWRYKHRFPGGVFWVNGESDENLRKSVVEILTFVNISASVTDNIEDILNKFLSWLSKMKRPWLLLQCFSEEEGALFLMQRTGLGGNDLDPDAICLAKELGSLPLALEQAAAYISSSPLPLDFKDYLKTYEEVKLRLLKQQHATALSLEAQHRLSTHTTWVMNFEYVKERSPAAAKIMRISAFFESEFIPFNVINPGSPECNQEELRGCSFSYTDIGDILKILSSYSLFSLLFEMTNVSIMKCNTKGANEGKKLMDNVMQKLFEFEKSGVVIEADVKFQILYRKANYFFVEGEVEKCYNALLELESLNLPISAANTAELQMRIAVIGSKGMKRNTSHRAMKAVDLAKKIYSSDDPKLLRMLQYAGMILYDSGNVKESKIYAKEMRDICTTLPPWSDDMGYGMHASLSYLCELNHEVMKDTLLEALEYRCPHIYSCILDGYVNNCIPYLEDGFEDFIDVQLQCLMKCVFVALKENNNAKKGYYWKAVCLAELGQRGPSLAAAAVAGSLFPLQWTQIPAVVEHFGCYIVKEVATSEDLGRAVEICENSLVIVVRSGKYVLTQPLKVPSNAVIVGLGKVDITCAKGVPLFLDKTVYIDKIELTPSVEFITVNKEKANKCLDLGQFDRALSLYSKVLATCPENTQLLTARASTYLKAAKEKSNTSERESLLELGVEDTKATIRADPSWLLGYYTRATIMTELGRKHEALASAAVFNHLSSGRDISSVIQRYGALQIHVVERSDELHNFLDEGVNQIVLMKEGEYLFEKSVEINPAIVVVGLGKVIVSCKTGAPFHFRKEHFVENVELQGDCGDEPESLETASSTSPFGQEEDISLALPSGYDASKVDSECKPWLEDKIMATGGWVADLDKKEHKNWVLIGCALNIAKSGISPKIQKEMEAWYRNLISSPPLQSLSPCTCPSAAKCTFCTTWRAELSRHHMAPRPKICWNNSDKNQWGSPAGAWEIAKLFMPTLGIRKMDVVDAETTDIGGLLNLMEWCPFLTPPVNKTVLCAARDECRNHWAHSPKQEIQDVDVPTIFSHLNNLLSDPVFNADKEAQKASQHLQDLFHQGLVNVRNSEMEALHLLRQSLASDLTKCQDDLTDVQTKVAQVDAETKKLYMAAQKDLSDVEEIAGVNKEDIGTLKAQVVKLKVDIQSDLSEVKEQGDLNNEDLSKLREELKTQLRDAEAYLSTEISTVLRSVDDFNTVLNQRDDLQEDLIVLHDDVEVVRNRMANVVCNLNMIQSKVLNFETNLASLKSAVQKVTIKMNTTETKISGLQEDFMDVKEDIFCTAPSRLPSFTGRTTALSWLEKNLVLESGVQSGAKTSCCTKTICGLGGCGKTSLAVEFAWINKSRFPGGVFWINGESDENINKSVAEVLALKNIFTPKGASIDETLTRFLTWLSNKELPWLLVVDNVDELQDPTCPTGVKKICKGPWQRNSQSPKRGHILLTTRQNARDAKAFLKNSCEDYLELQCFSEEEGVLFLTKRKGLEGKSLEPDAVALTKELGALPLALEQAAAYITASPIPLSFADYLKKYREVKLRLLKQQPAIALSMEAQHRLSVHTTWEMNFAYRVLLYFDPYGAKDVLCNILIERWPDLYKDIQSGAVTGVISDSKHEVDDSSYEHASMVLVKLMMSFSAHLKIGSKLSKEEGHFYRSVAEKLVSLRKKTYEDKHPDVAEANFYLEMVHSFLGNQETAFKLRDQLWQFFANRTSSHHVSGPTRPRCDHTVLSVRNLKNEANDCFKSGCYSRALNLYNEALTECPNDAKLLTNRAATYVKLSEQHGLGTEEKRKFLQLACQDANVALTTDPSWVKGYYWKAVCLSKLGQRGPSLAAAAVAKHFFPSQCSGIPAVVEHFGHYSINVIATVDELLELVKREAGRNLVILLKEGRYELTKSMKVPANAVVVGVGKVQIVCTKGVPLRLDETVYTENIELSSSVDSIKMLKEKAKESLNRGQLDEALSHYSKALAICSEDPQLLTARASTYLKSAEKNRNMNERESLLELALKDSESSIRADPSWFLGYHTKATSLAELGRKHEALAAAAVFNHLSSGRDISSVIQRYGVLQIHVVKSSDELRTVLQEITEREELNQIVLLKEGDYLLEKTVEMKQAIVVIGLGKVTVSCKTGVPFKFRKEHFVENVALHSGRGEEPTSHEAMSSRDDSGQEEDISLDLPSGYDNSSANSDIIMASGGWVAELDKIEHKNWVMVGCALNITKKGITSKIQNKMETWYQSLISSPPLQSLPSCACASSASKCLTCDTWKTTLKRHHTSGRPKICWDNSDRTQWGSPTGAWEIAKVFMPTLGGRKKDVVDAETTDIGGLLNLLEWCPFINPPTSRTVLTSARDECRNHWAHAPKQEIQDADLSTIFGHLNNLLNDAVFSSDKDAQQSSKDLQDLFHNGLVNVRKSEIEALHLHRHSLVANLTKCQGDVSDAQKEISKLAQQLDELKDVMAHYSNDLSTVLKAVDDFNRFLNKRDDLQKVFEAIQDDLEVVKTKLSVTQSKVANTETSLASLKDKVIEVQRVAMETSTEVSILQEKVVVLEKGQATQEQNDSDDDALCTAPSRLPLFTGRKSALDWLEKNLILESVEANPGTSCCTKTVCGLGGCGKTSLAVEFAWSHKNSFPGGVFWINGESDENINKSVAEMLSLGNIPTSTNDSIDDTLNKFLTWLSKKDLPWLLVMDNVDEMQDPMCPASVKKICKGPWQRTVKSLKNGHILLTTRQNSKDAKAFLRYSTDDFLELSCFSVEDGALFLMKRTDLRGESLDPDAICLTKELGALPLALEQAAAYITTSPIPLSFNEYLEKYQAVKMRLLKQQPATALSIEAQHRLSVHTTWELNFEFVKEQSPAAASMMQISAFLDSENVPIDVINPGLPELDQEELRECARSKIDIASILKVLSSYSLYSVDHRSKVFSVHKLVQEVVRTSLTPSQREEALLAATRVVYWALCTHSERNVIVSLVLNFNKLKNHMEEEIHSSKGNVARVLYNDDTLKLCNLVVSLISNNVFFNRLRAEMGEFRMNVSKMSGNSDPNSALGAMVSASINLRNCPGYEKYKEAKKVALETVEKLAEMEKSGIVVKPDIKYLVLEHMASYHALEGQWKENYKALMELERLEINDENTVDLQILIARAENQLSASNSRSALVRYKKALELARRIYPPDHRELLRVLQFITSHLLNEGKVHEARKYAEELLNIAKKQPPTSDFYFKGITDALQVMCFFDPKTAEDTLFRILEDNWPVMYKCIQGGDLDTGECVVDESSHDHAAMVLAGIMSCFLISSVQPEKSKQAKFNGKLYRNIGEMLLSLRRKMYDESHQEVQTAYLYLQTVFAILGNKDEAYNLGEQMKRSIEKPVTKPFSARPLCDVNVFIARNYKETANNFFRAQKYSEALEFYQKALDQFPNDAKILTNKAATYVKLSEEQALKSHSKDPKEDQQIFLQYALQDANKAVSADPSWVKGYYWKAVCLAKLGQRGPSLAAAAVAEHLLPSQCTDIPAVMEHFGSCSTQVITTIDDLYHAAKRADGNNLVILLKEGRYELPNPLKVPANAVMVGIGKVQIICPRSVPLKLDETVYTENIELLSSTDSIKIFKEKAKESLNRGQLDEALSLYSKALAICPKDAQLLTARASTYLKAAEEKRNMSERVSLLELAFKDSESSIRADPSWLLGYSTKAMSLAELGRKQEALAAAAVFNHLSSGRDISSVIESYGALQIDVVKNSDELRNVLQQITEREDVNQIVLLKEGDYLLEKTVEMKPAIVIVGSGKVIVSCKTGVPFHFRKEHYVENVELHRGGGETLESHTTASSTDDSGQEDVISLPVPSGYDDSSANSECKVN
ncbi:unnamed protein product [Porites evermanni]|uniref:DUF7779 domain-containing protein n=1 Tax=Porites evermanni TaxID=104178 RepID=A0ABN8LKP7_9CNID|nr:unnamed protein product [Porites evermanni]